MAIIGVGTEIVECVRIAKMIETHGEQFLARVYSSDEIDYCLQRANTTQLFATRWVAKEAVMKAMRCQSQGIRWTEIEILVEPVEGPTVFLGGKAEIWADRLGIEEWYVSVAACRTHATAYVLAISE